jgi:hypothetical protein
MERRKETASMESENERDDLEVLIEEFSAADPEFPRALAAAEERLAMVRCRPGHPAGPPHPADPTSAQGRASL